MDNQSSVQQIRREHGILVTSVRLDQAATSPTLLHGVKSDEDIRRSLAHVPYLSFISFFTPIRTAPIQSKRNTFLATHCVAVRYVPLLPFHLCTVI
jgi:hypothetical protein